MQAFLDLVGSRGESLNLSPPENPEDVLEALKEWNEQLENHKDIFGGLEL